MVRPAIAGSVIPVKVVTRVVTGSKRIRCDITCKYGFHDSLDRMISLIGFMKQKKIASHPSLDPEPVCASAADNKSWDKWIITL